MNFQELRERFPKAPAHAIFAALFVMNVRKDEGADYPASAALGRYAICSDIIMSDEENRVAYEILEAVQS